MEWTPMASIKLYVPDELRQRMGKVSGEDWSAVARQAFESHLERLATAEKAGGQTPSDIDGQRAVPTPDGNRAGNAAYEHGYAWARDRAGVRDLRAVVDAPNYRSAAGIVRRTKGFSQHDEFGDWAQPSDEMWEAFVDGATARYNDNVNDH
jgi:hypothetical protein